DRGPLLCGRSGQCGCDRAGGRLPACGGGVPDRRWRPGGGRLVTAGPEGCPGAYVDRRRSLLVGWLPHVSALRLHLPSEGAWHMDRAGFRPFGGRSHHVLAVLVLKPEPVIWTAKAGASAFGPGSCLPKPYGPGRNPATVGVCFGLFPLGGGSDAHEDFGKRGI